MIDIGPEEGKSYEKQEFTKRPIKVSGLKDEQLGGLQGFENAEDLTRLGTAYLFWDKLNEFYYNDVVVCAYNNEGSPVGTIPRATAEKIIEEYNNGKRFDAVVCMIKKKPDKGDGWPPDIKEVQIIVNIYTEKK